MTTFSFYPNIKENKAEENSIFSTLGKNNSKIEITVTITRQPDKKENNLIANVKQENLNIYEAIKNELEDWSSVTKKKSKGRPIIPKDFSEEALSSHLVKRVRNFFENHRL